MKRYVQFITAICFILSASSAMALELEPVVALDDPVVIGTPTLTATVQLTVNANGIGTVISNPEGINCIGDVTTQTGDCSANFALNTVVALKATMPPPDDNGSYLFCNWNSEPDNNIDVLGILMDGAKTVDANFCALGVPAVLVPPPTTSEMYTYMPVDDPDFYAAIPDAKPIAIVERADGGVDIVVGLISYGDASGGVDVYVGLTIEGHNDFFLINSSGNIVSLSSGLTPWKTDTSSVINDETVLEIPGAFMPLLPSGMYHVHLMVTPTGSTAFYYYYLTYFENLHFLINPFLLAP